MLENSFVTAMGGFCHREFQHPGIRNTDVLWKDEREEEQGGWWGRRGTRVKIDVKRVFSVRASEGDTALKSHCGETKVFPRSTHEALAKPLTHLDSSKRNLLTAE